jgi:hypothetical protein
MMIVEQSVEFEFTGEPKYSEKTCPSATLSTTNPPWPDPGSNAGRRSGKPATNRLSYGTTFSWKLSYNLEVGDPGLVGDTIRDFLARH